MHEIQLTHELRNGTEKHEQIEEKFSDFYEWMITNGKAPERNSDSDGEGDVQLSDYTAKNYLDRLDQLFRFSLTFLEPDDPTMITHEEADLLQRYLDRGTITNRDGEVYSDTASRKFSNTLVKYFEWRYYGDCWTKEIDCECDDDNCECADDGDEEYKDHYSESDPISELWYPKITFSDSHHESADKLSFEERWIIREEAKNYGSLPDYYSTSPEQRDRIDALVAQKLGKKKFQITRKDWETVDESLKIGSLVAVGLDTGITPVEVANFSKHWVQKRRNIIKIPTEKASKGREGGEIPITEDTANLLGKWIKERRYHEEYDDTDRLWLNKHGNPYDSKNLCYLVRELCKSAGIPIEGRKIVWYSLRHNAGNLLEEVGNLPEAGDQLRHKSYNTTKETYSNTASERRRFRLEQINELSQRTAEEPGFNPFAELEKGFNQPVRNNSAKNEPTKTGKIHIDAIIKDTSEARNKFAIEILEDSNND